ncbi:MAG TPA: winged helix-turn-helix domain-containing protein, partial [Blastocatellia bacterium]
MRKPASYYEFGPFLLDVAERRLLRDGQTIPLTRRAFETLLVLVQNNGRVIEKGELMKKIWQDSFVEEATLAQNIFTLRKILEERPNEIQYIETVPKYGYRFVAKVNEWSDERQEEVSKKSTEPDREIRSLAVLPFTLLMPGEDYEHFGIAMADALITKLSNVKKISVRPTSAILKYAHQNQDSISIGKELKVKLVLEGKIILFGDRMRVTLQL